MLKINLLGIVNHIKNAVKCFNQFKDSDKAIFDLYAGTHVQNCLVNFESTINNVFISGMSVGIPDSPYENSIKIASRKLISAMKKDIGIT